MSGHAPITEEHRKFIERLKESIVECDNPVGAAQLLADHDAEVRREATQC